MGAASSRLVSRECGRNWRRQPNGQGLFDCSGGRRFAETEDVIGAGVLDADNSADSRLANACCIAVLDDELVDGRAVGLVGDEKLGTLEIVA